MPASIPAKMGGLRDLKDSVWRVQLKSVAPNVIDEVHRALKLKAEKDNTSVTEINVQQQEILLTWRKVVSYNCADDWVRRQLTKIFDYKIYDLKSENHHPPEKQDRPPKKKEEAEIH